MSASKSRVSSSDAPLSSSGLTRGSSLYSKLATTLLILSLVFLPLSPVQAARVLQTQPDLIKTNTTSYLPLSSHLTLMTENKTDKKVLVKDYLASTRSVLDKTGQVLTSTSYYPYGSPITPISNPPTDRLFTNHRKLDDTSVYHAGARFYSPSFGLFLQPDVVEGPNRYAYAGNNPIMFSDPTGNMMDPGYSISGGSSRGGSRGRSEYIDLSQQSRIDQGFKDLTTSYQMDPNQGIPDSVYYGSQAFLGGMTGIGALQVGGMVASACLLNPYACTITAGTLGEIAMGDALPPIGLGIEVPGPGLITPLFKIKADGATSEMAENVGESALKLAKRRARRMKYREMVGLSDYPPIETGEVRNYADSLIERIRAAGYVYQENLGWSKRAVYQAVHFKPIPELGMPGRIVIGGDLESLGSREYISTLEHEFTHLVLTRSGAGRMTQEYVAFLATTYPGLWRNTAGDILASYFTK